jgi:hypothetical protein
MGRVPAKVRNPCHNEPQASIVLSTQDWAWKFCDSMRQFLAPHPNTWKHKRRRRFLPPPNHDLFFTEERRTEPCHRKTRESSPRHSQSSQFPTKDSVDNVRSEVRLSQGQLRTQNSFSNLFTINEIQESNLQDKFDDDFYCIRSLTRHTVVKEIGPKESAESTCDFKKNMETNPIKKRVTFCKQFESISDGCKSHCMECKGNILGEHHSCKMVDGALVQSPGGYRVKFLDTVLVHIIPSRYENINFGSLVNLVAKANRPRVECKKRLRGVLKN